MAARATAASDQAVLAEGEALAVADYEVIEHAHVDQGEGLLQAPRDEFVRLARLEDPGGVVVGEHHRRGIVQKRLAQHFARVHAGAVDGAPEQFLERDQPVAVVQIQAAYLYLPDGARQGATRKLFRCPDMGYLWA